MADKQKNIELIGLSLFGIGILGLLLFFYMAFALFTEFSVAGAVTLADPSQAASDFYTYLLRLTIPLITLLIVGGVSLLAASKGISTYSGNPGKHE